MKIGYGISDAVHIDGVANDDEALANANIRLNLKGDVSWFYAGMMSGLRED